MQAPWKGKEGSQRRGLGFQCISQVRMLCPGGTTRYFHILCVLNHFAFQDMFLK